MKKLPIGEQDFEFVRTKDMVYVDKTDIIYQMIKNSRMNFRERSYMTETALLRNLTYIKNYKNSVI